MTHIHIEKFKSLTVSFIHVNLKNVYEDFHVYFVPINAVLTYNILFPMLNMPCKKQIKYQSNKMKQNNFWCLVRRAVSSF